MGLAGVFILQSFDYKRMLAYSSVEHMGILSVGIGLGGSGVFGSLLHAVNHSMAKTMLFLTAGNILISYHTKKIQEIGGLLKSLPITGALWFAGFLAITGSPPFGTFLSEFTILKSSIDHQRWIVCSLYLLFLCVAFVGMLRPFVNMTFGKSEVIRTREPMTSIAPQIILILLSLFLGTFIPEHFKDILNEAAGYLGGAGIK
jgi:hydrogenase-4 component F